MESKEVSEFICKFQELNSTNQKYILAIQEALAFAQETSEKGAGRKAKENLFQE